MLQISLVGATTGRPQIQYRVGDRRRQTLRLGLCPEEIAKAVKKHVHDIILAKLFAQAPPPAAQAWLQGLDSKFYEKLVKHKLVKSRVSEEVRSPKVWTVMELANYCINLWYKDNLTGSTARFYRDARDNLVAYFSLFCPTCEHLTAAKEYLKPPLKLHCEHCGRDKPDGDHSWPIDQINAGHADEFVDWMFTEAYKGNGYKPATANKRISHARRFFKQAIRLKMVGDNPFLDIHAAREEIDDRKFYVTREVIDTLMTNETNDEFRLIIALVRFGALRCPSEVAPLKRGWVGNDEFKVYSPKHAHLPKKRWRYVPIFPELRPYLDAVMDLPGDPDDKLITRYKCTERSLTSVLQKLCTRSGIKIWPKVMMNMRSTRTTELEDCNQFSEASLDSWLGNTKAVRRKHYNQVTREQRERALVFEVG